MSKKLEMIKYVCVRVCYYRDKKWAIGEKMEAEPLVDVPHHFITQDKHAIDLIKKRKEEAEAEKSLEDRVKELDEKLAFADKENKGLKKVNKELKKNKVVESNSVTDLTK